MNGKDRDKHGRFIRGNIPINLRDPKTGQFTSHKRLDHSVVVEKVDRLIEEN